MVDKSKSAQMLAGRAVWKLKEIDIVSLLKVSSINYGIEDTVIR